MSEEDAERAAVRAILTYKDLRVWQRSVELTKAVYALTAHFPVEEKFGLTAQMRRAAVSIPSNIAEGKGRDTRKEYAHFLTVAYGSATELETQVTIVKQLPFGAKLDYHSVEELLLEVLKMLGTMRKRLR